MKYNATQLLVADISGYTPFDGENSARDDGYYDQVTTLEKLDYLTQYIASAPVYEWYKDADITKAWIFLESDFSGENERYHAFKEL